MRCFYLILPALVFFAIGKVAAQPLTNEGFESWSNQEYYDEPDYWETSNVFTYLTSKTTYVSKTQDSYQGNYALQIQTDTSTITSFPVTLNSPNNEGAGVPFSEKPDSIIFYVKHDIAAGDSASLNFEFEKGGNYISGTSIYFKGTINSYTRISLPITWTQGTPNPDTLKANIFPASSQTAENTLTIDNIHFRTTAATFPNGDFEQWSTLSSEEPDGWGSFNVFNVSQGTSPMVTKSTDSRSGDFSARIETQITAADTFGVMFSGNLGDFFGGDNAIPKGVAINDNPESFSFYYKYDPNGVDTAAVYYALSHYDQNLDSTVLLEEKTVTLNQQGSYTEQTVQVDYDSTLTADSLLIAFGSSNTFFNENDASNVGSTLFVDDLAVSYPSTGIKQAVNNNAFQLFPNPARSTLKLKTQESHKELTLNISNLNGKVVKQVNLPASSASSEHAIDLNNLESGLYIYQLNNQEGNTQQTGKLQVID